MICDTKKDKQSLQAKALKELKKNGGISIANANKNEIFKTADKVDPKKNVNNSKPIVAKESLPLKHQSKVVTNENDTRSKLDAQTQKSNEIVKNKNSKDYNKSNFQSKLDKFSRDEFDKHEEKHIHDNLDRN